MEISLECSMFTSLELRHPDGRPFAEGWESLRRAERLEAKLRSLGMDPDEV